MSALTSRWRRVTLSKPDFADSASADLAATLGSAPTQRMAGFSPSFGLISAALLTPLGDVIAHEFAHYLGCWPVLSPAGIQEAPTEIALHAYPKTRILHPALSGWARW